MRYVVQRLGFRISRGWAILLVVLGVLAGTAFWIGPFRPMPADLRLVALGGDGQFRPVIGYPETWADTTPPQPDVPVRFPLVLAVYNAGARAATPERVALSIPARFRISNSDGLEYPGRVQVGNPLVRYVFEIKPGRIQPRQLPRVLTTLDTLWLEPVVPSYYCTALADSIPEFTLAPQQDPKSLSRVEIFYSFDARVRDRQSGLLTLQLPPRLLERAPPPEPPQFQTTVYRPRAPRPTMNALRAIGARTTHCGDPGSAMELLSSLYETAERGRFFVIDYGGAPRKYLFDLDRDSIIELEMWDVDNDGVFESSRPARLTIPEFLLPPRPIVVARRDSVPGDSIRADSARLAGGIPGDSAAPPAVTTPGPPAAPAAPTGFRFPAVVFHNTDAGVLRFWRAEQRARGVEVPEPAPRRREPALLGRPLPNYPTPPRDTVRRDTIPTTTTGN